MAKAFVIPFVIYLLGTAIAARFSTQWYPLAYAVVTLITGGTAIHLLWGTNAFKMHGRIAIGVTAGLVGIAMWIGLCELQLEQALAQYLPSWLQPGERVGFNPFEKFSNPLAIWSFVAIRLIGIALVVPLAEELFWRGFLLRWTIDQEWEKVPLGEFTLSSCLMVTAMFTLAHPEWLAAAVYCLLLNGLLYWKRDLWLCIVAHAVSNFTLAVYVLITGAWWLW